MLAVNPDLPQPEWWLESPVLPLNEENGWDRSNTGQYVTVVNSRTLKIECNYHEQTGVDGAIWDKGFSKGKHVFAFMWPRDQRIYYESQVTVGVGYPMGMHKDYGARLIGGNGHSVGLDLVDNSLWYDGFKVATYPKKSRRFVIPTLVYMYVDFDLDRLAFGTGRDFWGIALDFRNVRANNERDYPLFPMVAFRKVAGKFMLFYKGHGNYFLILLDFFHKVVEV